MDAAWNALISATNISEIADVTNEYDEGYSGNIHSYLVQKLAGDKIYSVNADDEETKAHKGTNITITATGSIDAGQMTADSVAIKIVDGKIVEIESIKNDCYVGRDVTITIDGKEYVFTRIEIRLRSDNCLTIEFIEKCDENNPELVLTNIIGSIMFTGSPDYTIGLPELK